MARWDALTDRMWRCLEPHLPENGKRGGQWRDHRQVIGGMLWKLRIGAPWPGALWAMPARFGPWQTAYDRLGRSRGGLTSKVHLACDGRGRPLSIVVTAGQRHERAQLVAVVDGIRVPRPGRGR